MKYLLILLFAFFNIFSMNAQKTKAYAKFFENPEKRISCSHLEDTEFFVEYKSKKKVTIYLELIKDDLSYGYANKTIKSKEKRVTQLNLRKRPGVDTYPGTGYTIRLQMYEGDVYDMKTLISETIVEDINLTRLLYTKL